MECSTQELLKMTYAAGQSQKQQGKEAEPLTYLLWLTNFFVLDEVLARQVIEHYQAGYVVVGGDALVQKCPYGCGPARPVCLEGIRLCQEAQYLASLLPAVLPLHPTKEQQQILEAFYQVGDAYLRHIGEYKPDREH